MIPTADIWLMTPQYLHFSGTQMSHTHYFFVTSTSLSVVICATCCTVFARECDTSVAGHVVKMMMLSQFALSSCMCWALSATMENKDIEFDIILYEEFFIIISRLFFPRLKPWWYLDWSVACWFSVIWSFAIKVARWSINSQCESTKGSLDTQCAKKACVKTVTTNYSRLCLSAFLQPHF